MADRAQIEELVTTYVEAVGRQDVGGVLACFAPDAIQEDPLGRPANEGIDAIRGFFEKSFRASFEVSRDGDVRVGGDYASFRFTITVPPASPDGDPFVIRVADLIKAQDTGDGLRIAHIWAIQDMG